MRTAITIVAFVLLAQGAAAQTAVEQAQIVRDFEQSVLDYTLRQHRLAVLPTAIDTNTPPAKIFTLPVAMVFRQMIARALSGHAGEPAIFGVGIAHRATALEPFPGTDLYEFPGRLADALPKLPPPLEYRLIFNDLVIRDNHADIIVAVLRDAVGPFTTR